MGQISNKKHAITSQYYSLIKQTQNDIYTKYNNQEICQSVANPANKVDPVDWKEFIKARLQLQASKYKWAHMIYTFINSEPFIIESKWRDHIFYCSFAKICMGANPNPLLISSIGVGTSHLNMDEFECAIQRQIGNCFNPFNQLISYFRVTIVEEHSEVFNLESEHSMISNDDLVEIAKGSFSSPNTYNENLQGANGSIVEFSHILIKSLKMYYNLSLDQKKVLTNLQDTLYFITLQEIIHSNLYSMMKIMYQKQYEKHESILKHKMHELKGVKAKGIIKNKYHSFDCEEEINKTLESNKGQYSAEYLRKLHDCIQTPYSPFIKSLCNFNKLQSLHKKFTILKKFRSEIENYLSEIWKPLLLDNMVDVTCTAETTLEIFEYIIVKADNVSIFSDIALLCDYFYKIIKGDLQYTLNMFQCALTVLIEINMNDYPLKQLMNNPRSKNHLLIDPEDE